MYKTLRLRCVKCNVVVNTTVIEEDLVRWMNREEQLFPYLSPTERSILLKAVCDTCPEIKISDLCGVLRE